MAEGVLIVGQGLAGTVLAWALERAGITFVIVDGGQAPTATAAAAGIINPITGRRLVKSSQIEMLLPIARAFYHDLGTALGVPLWREMRVRRLFADDHERTVFASKQARGELAPFAGESDDSGFWIKDAARVDLPSLILATRAHWRQSGHWRPQATESAFSLVIDCSGAAITRRSEFGFAPWEFSRGEIIEVAVAGLSPDVVLNRRHWIVPLGTDTAWVGATHQPGLTTAVPSLAGRLELERSARSMLGQRPFAVTGQRCGVRVNLPDKHPIAGPHPSVPRLGLVNGLGSKGVLWAPFLAQQWVAHLLSGTPFLTKIAALRWAGP